LAAKQITMSEERTKKVTISLTATQQKMAKKISKAIIGKENISGLFAFWINQNKDFAK
jgi:hypothetical protein